MAVNIPMKLKKQLQLYLEYYDLTAAQLSRKSGVSQQVLSQWLRGADPRKISQVKSVSEALGCSVDHLCFGEGLERERSPEPLIGAEDWLSGLFEVKIRRIKK